MTSSRKSLIITHFLTCSYIQSLTVLDDRKDLFHLRDFLFAQRGHKEALYNKMCTRYSIHWGKVIFLESNSFPKRELISPTSSLEASGCLAWYHSSVVSTILFERGEPFPSVRKRGRRKRDPIGLFFMAVCMSVGRDTRIQTTKSVGFASLPTNPIWPWEKAGWLYHWGD